MNRSLSAFLLFASAAAFSLFAATSVSFSLGMSTGDSDFDLTLRNINVEAQKSLPSYYTSMGVSYGTQPEVIDGLLYRHRLSPADAFMVIRLSFFIGKPVDYMVVRYAKHRGKGWGALAKSLGIKPGSPAFHELKKGGVVVLDHSRKERAGVDININVKAGKDHHGPGDGKKGSPGGGGKGKGKNK